MRPPLPLGHLCGTKPDVSQAPLFWNASDHPIWQPYRPMAYSAYIGTNGREQGALRTKLFSQFGERGPQAVVMSHTQSPRREFFPSAFMFSLCAHRQEDG